MENIKLENGKYEVVVNQAKGKFEFYANRYNDTHWRDLVGDGMTLAMFYRIQELEEQVKKYEDRLQISPYGDDKVDELESCIGFLRSNIEALEKQHKQLRRTKS